MTDPMRFPGAELVELYLHRWEIELGYRKLKHSLQQHRQTLRSKKPEGVRQELWELVLAYNLLRYQMIRMAASLKGSTASQLSFHLASVYLIHELCCLPYISPGNVPEQLTPLEEQAAQFILPDRGERSYPRCVKPRPQTYATRKKNASQAELTGIRARRAPVWTAKPAGSGDFGDVGLDLALGLRGLL